MAKNKKTKFITKDILKSSIIGSFQKLDPRYMIKKSGHVCRRNWMFHHTVIDFLYRPYLEEASSTGFIMGL